MMNDNQCDKMTDIVHVCAGLCVVVFTVLLVGICLTLVFDMAYRIYQMIYGMVG